MAPYFNNSASDTKIRIICALCYMTIGVAGLIYILLQGKNNESQFLRFHFIQSLLIGIFMTLAGWLSSGLTQFLGGLFGIFGAGGMSLAMPVMVVLGYAFQALQLVFMIALIYGLIQSLRGKYADMPVVSKIVRNNMR